MRHSALTAAAVLAYAGSQTPVGRPDSTPRVLLVDGPGTALDTVKAMEAAREAGTQIVQEHSRVRANEVSARGISEFFREMPINNPHRVKRAPGVSARQAKRMRKEKNREINARRGHA